MLPLAANKLITINNNVIDTSSFFFFFFFGGGGGGAGGGGGGVVSVGSRVGSGGGDRKNWSAIESHHMNTTTKTLVAYGNCQPA